MTKECSYCSVRRRNPDGLGFGKNIRSETKYVNGQTRTASVYMVNVDHKNVGVGENSERWKTMTNKEQADYWHAKLMRTPVSYQALATYRFEQWQHFLELARTEEMRELDE